MQQNGSLVRGYGAAFRRVETAFYASTCLSCGTIMTWQSKPVKAERISVSTAAVICNDRWRIIGSRWHGQCALQLVRIPRKTQASYFLSFFLNCRGRTERFAALLLRHGADPDARDENGAFSPGTQTQHTSPGVLHEPVC